MISFSLTNLARPRSKDTDWALQELLLVEPVQRTEARVISRPSFLSLFVSLGGAGNGMHQELVSLSRRKVSFSFDKQHWHLQPGVQELGSRLLLWEKF